MEMVPYPEPTWGQSQQAYEPCTSLLATGITPFILTGIIIRLLQYHFSDPANIINDSLRRYRWKEDCNEVIVAPDGTALGGIYVGLGYEFKPSMVQQRPGLFVKREPVTVSRLSAIKGDQALPHIKRNVGVYQGAEFQKQLVGRFSIVCAGANGSEADILGEEVFYRMLYFAPLIKEDIRIGQFTVESLSDVKDLENDGIHAFYSVVSLLWAHVPRWAAVPETPLLKRLRLVQKNFARQ